MGLQIYNRIFFTYIRSVGICKMFKPIIISNINREYATCVSKKNHNKLCKNKKYIKIIISFLIDPSKTDINNALGNIEATNLDEKEIFKLINVKLTKLNPIWLGDIVELNKIYTPLDIAACLFYEEKVEQILIKNVELSKDLEERTKENYPPSIYLRDPENMVNHRDPNKIIAKIYCWNQKICKFLVTATQYGWKKAKTEAEKVEKAEAAAKKNHTPLENLTQQNWVRNYQEMEKKRGGILTIGLIIEIIFAIGLPLDWVILGPVLLIWRRIIKGAQRYLDDYFLINGSMGCYKFYITPKYGDKNFVYRYRAFLKQTVCISPMSNCIKPETITSRWKFKIQNYLFPELAILNKNETDYDDKCRTKVEKSKQIFEEHWKKYTFNGNRIIRSKTCGYNMVHFIILSDRKDLFEFLLKFHEKDLHLLLGDTCEIQIPQTHCNISKKGQYMSSTGWEMLEILWGKNYKYSKKEKELDKEIERPSPTSILDFFPIDNGYDSVQEGKVGDYSSDNDGYEGKVGDYSSDDSSEDSYDSSDDSYNVGDEGNVHESKKEEEELILKF